jgi:hypothetical protein
MPSSWNELVTEYQDLKDQAESEDDWDSTDDADRWDQLSKLNEEVNDLLDFGPNASCEWICETEWKGYVKDFAIDMGWITGESPLFYYIDWEGVGDEQLKADFDEVEWEGYTYYFKDAN